MAQASLSYPYLFHITDNISCEIIPIRDLFQMSEFMDNVNPAYFTGCHLLYCFTTYAPPMSAQYLWQGGGGSIRIWEYHHPIN